MTSTAKKMDNSRHGFSTPPAARKVTGAFAQEGTGSRRRPGTATSKKGMAAALRSMKTTARRAKG